MKYEKGFNLVELLIVVALIGILAAVAIPQYSQYVVKGNRAAAQAIMMDLANREKQYLLDARSYTESLTALGMSTLPADVASNYTMTISAPAATPPTFVITATPVPNSKQATANDGVLTLTDAGVKQPAGKW